MRTPVARLLSLALALAGCELLVKPDSVPPPGAGDACQPLDCIAQGRTCGPADDGCGRHLDCGACSGTDQCVEGACSPCQPDCTNRQCGSDGCNSECGGCGVGKVCDTKAGACIGCLADSDCTASPSGHHCHPVLRECVVCVNEYDCDPGGKVPCDEVTHLCAPVGCQGEGDCSGATPHCDLPSHACVLCRDNSDCTGGASRCKDQRSCVDCLLDADCPGQRCDPATNTCRRCLSSADCKGTTPKCNPQGSCVECLTGTDCTGSVCLPDGQCQGSGKPTDGCDQPGMLTFTNSLATVTGDTGPLADDNLASCDKSGSKGSDAVYHFALAEAHDVEVVVWPSSFSYRPLLSVSSACASGELACGCSRAPGIPTSANLTNLAAGDYYAWVDGYSSSGPFTLSVALYPPSSPMPDLCSQARELLFDAQGQAFVTSTTVGAKSDAKGSCGGQSSPDIAFAIDTTAAHALDVQVFSLETPGTYQPVVFVRDACVSPTELACDAGSAMADSAKISINDLPPGNYKLWIDGLSGQPGGRFALWASLSAPR